MHRLKIYFILSNCIFLTSCGNYLEQKTPIPSLDRSAQLSLSSGFRMVKETIFSVRCISCHQQYNSYSGVIRELTAIKESVSMNRMPKTGGPLTENQKSILFAWIAKGAPEQSQTSDNPGHPAPLRPDWISLSENVFFPKCLVCHNSEGQARFLDLSTRQVIFDNRNRMFGGDKKLINLDNPEDSYLIHILNDEEEPMPPAWSNIPRLSEQELTMISRWIRLGLP